MKEIYENIPGFDGYQISNMGNCRSIDRLVRDIRAYKIKGRILKGEKTKQGYIRYSIYRNQKRHTFFAHRLVATAFIGNPPDNKPFVNHIDCNKENNCVDNLEWVSHEDNVLHALRNNLYPAGCEIESSKLDWNDVFIIRRLYDTGMSSKEISLVFTKVNHSTINKICNRKTWRHLP